MHKMTLLAVATLVALPAQAQDRSTDASFKWSSAMDAGHTVYVRNLNGGIRTEAGTGNTVEVRAEKRWRKGDPKTVSVTATKTSRGDILVCVMYEGRTTRCDEDGYSSHSDDSWWKNNRDNDVSMDVTVTLPKGAKTDLSTVNGGLTIDGASAEVKARTVNGGIEATSTGGPVSARTVNGGIRVKAGSVGDGPLEYETVNGAIELSLPENLNVDLEARTVNGSVTSEDFPITIQGRIDRRRLRGKIGKGGPELRLVTVNGSIRLRKN